MESAEKTPWIDPIRPPGRDLTRAAARVAQEENRCGSRFFGAAPPFFRYRSGNTGGPDRRICAEGDRIKRNFAEI